MKQGWRFFHCEECGQFWKETCRDAESLSGSPCPNEECSAPTSPDDYLIDEEVVIDAHGNLTGGEQLVVQNRSKRAN